LRRRRGAAEQGTHPGDQLARGKRLRQVIVTTNFEPDDAVHFAVARREKQDRHGAISAHGAADVSAVHFRQHHVQDDQIRDEQIWPGAWGTNADLRQGSGAIGGTGARSCWTK
jgi:hypothetical protein